MSSPYVMWQHVWLAALGSHLAAHLSPLLPEDRELLAGGLQLSIVVRRPNEPLVVVSTMNLPTPDEESAVSTRTVHRVLADLQDEIAIHLGRAWPLSESGTALTAEASEAADGIALSFLSRAGDEEIRLAPFRPPPPLDEARVAG